VVSPTSRLSASSPDRAGEWKTTWAEVARHPLLGVGPSNLDLKWRDDDGRLLSANSTHNEFLQLAAEQGLPGAAIAVVTIGALALALARRHEQSWLPSGVLAGLAAFVVSSTLDFTWHVPLLPIVMAALVGTALQPGAYGLPAPTRSER
jgi:O-antigen ligase